MSNLQTFNKALLKHVNSQNTKDFCAGDYVTFVNGNLGLVISSHDDLVTVLFSTKINHYDDLFQHMSKQIQQEIDSDILNILKNFADNT